MARASLASRTGILDAAGHFWTFDAEGRIDAGLREGMGDWMDLALSPASRRKVVDLVAEIKKKKLYERDRWGLSNDDLDRIAADIYGPAPDVATVTGKAPKKPALTYEAKRALQEIDRQVEAIKSKAAGG